MLFLSIISVLLCVYVVLSLVFVCLCMIVLVLLCLGKRACKYHDRLRRSACARRPCAGARLIFCIAPGSTGAPQGDSSLQMS